MTFCGRSLTPFCVLLGVRASTLAIACAHSLHLVCFYFIICFGYTFFLGHLFFNKRNEQRQKQKDVRGDRRGSFVE